MEPELPVIADAEAAVAEPRASTAQCFYVVSLPKFWALYLATFGLYGLYWNYQHWAKFKRATKGDQWPVARSLFSIFFVHALFREIDGRLRRNRIAFAWNPESTATVVVIILLVGSITSRMSGYGVGVPYTNYIAMASIPFVAFFKQSAQRAANAACDDPAGMSNSKCTVANFIWLIVGAIFWLLVLIGLAIGPR